MSQMNHPNSTPSSFRSKLGSYATGLAIGCVLMGFFFYQKYKANQRYQQSQQIQPQHIQQKSPPPTSPTPSPPEQQP